MSGSLPTLRFNDFWCQQYATQGQYFFTREISQRIGSIVAYAAYRAGLSPNAVTVLGLPVMLAASLCLGLSVVDPAYRWWALLLYQLGFGIDCADGQLARGTQRTSEFGAWLDNTCDHIRYTAIILALGAVLIHAPELPAAAVVASLFILGCGQSVGLHTVSTLKGGAFKPHGLTGFMDFVKWATKTLSDTPLFLLTMCVLVPFPWLLTLYIAAIGFLSLAQAIALGLLRMKQ